MRHTIIIGALTRVIAVVALGVKVIFLASPEAGAEIIVGSSGISPEEILRNLPDRNNLPIAEHDNAI